MTQIQTEFNASSQAHARVAVNSHQRDFALWLGLHVAVVWNASDEAMSLAEINSVVTIARAENVTLVLSNRPSGTDVGASMAAEINAKHVVLANFPGDENTTDYLAMITQNANRIIQATNPVNNTIGMDIFHGFFWALVIGITVVSFQSVRRIQKI